MSIRDRIIGCLLAFFHLSIIFIPWLLLCEPYYWRGYVGAASQFLLLQLSEYLKDLWIGE